MSQRTNPALRTKSSRSWRWPAHVRLALAPAARPHPRPGGVLALIILAVTAALWFYVFPWASLHLPIDSSGFNG